MHLALAVLQETASSGVPQSPPPFSILQLGKAFFTLSFFTLVTAGVTARAAWRLKRGSTHVGEARSAIDLCLFCGAFTFGVGGFHVLMGLVSTSLSVRMAAPIGPDEQWLVANGVMTALLAGAWGLAVLLLASLAWLVLRARARRGEQPSYDSRSASVG